MTYAEELVYSTLARRLDRDPSSIRATHHVEDDLGIDTFDLVLIALDIECAMDAEFPFARLGRIRTVGDLVAGVRDLLHEIEEAAPDTIREAS